MREKGSILALQLHPVIYISLKEPVRKFKKDSGVDLETQMLLNNLIVTTISVKISHNTLTYNLEKVYLHLLILFRPIVQYHRKINNY